jgi:hypothetical protein
MQPSLVIAMQPLFAINGVIHTLLSTTQPGQVVMKLAA